MGWLVSHAVCWIQLKYEATTQPPYGWEKFKGTLPYITKAKHAAASAISAYWWDAQKLLEENKKERQGSFCIVFLCLKKKSLFILLTLPTPATGQKQKSLYLVKYTQKFSSLPPSGVHISINLQMKKKSDDFVWLLNGALFKFIYSLSLFSEQDLAITLLQLDE